MIGLRKKKKKLRKHANDLNNESYENINDKPDNYKGFQNKRIRTDENSFKFEIKNEEDYKKDDNLNDEDEQEEEEEEIEINNKKCSLDEHKEIDAIFYCQECKINMCNKCEKIHSGLLKNHHMYSLDKDINDIFTGLCIKPQHSMALDYYCKTHNLLCCAACISKIRNKGNGQHRDCEVYYIIKIKNQKKENLEKNIKNLEKLSSEVEPTIKELKNIYEKINEKKDKLKMEIQKLFTKLRTELNNREDKLYEEIDKKFNQLFFKEDLIKESEKLPNLIKISLERGNLKNNEWNDKNNLSKMINACINLENMVIKINDIYDKIKFFKANKDLDIIFSPKNDEIEKGLMNNIKKFGALKVVDKNDINLYEFNYNDIMQKGINY